MIKMKPKLASEFIDASVEFSANLNTLVAKAKCEFGADEFQKLQRATGEVLFCILTEIINPLVKQHPELRPEKLEPPP